MVSIAKVADRIGEHISKQAGLPGDNNKICYGIEIVLVVTLTVSFVLITGWILGIFWETLLITLSALIMKNVIGGTHLSGFLRCVILSTLSIIFLAFGLKRGLFDLPLPLLYFWLLAGIYTIARYAPITTAWVNFNEDQIRQRIVIAQLMFSLLIIINIYQPGLISTGALIGTSFSVINISPIGATFVNWIESLTKKEVW